MLAPQGKSGYYRWLVCPESVTRRENQKIYSVLKASYEQNKGRIGLDKLLDDVRLKFPHCGRNRERYGGGETQVAKILSAPLAHRFFATR